MADVFESEIIQGDTGPVWHISVPSINVDGNNAGNETLTNYTCVLVYNNSDGDEITREVTTKNSNNDEFLVQITSVESNSMSIGLNRIVVQIKDSAGTPYRSEVQIDLTVKSQRYQE